MHYLDNKYKFFISESLRVYQNKIIQNKDKFNKFLMENIQARAKNQLLNIQQHDQGLCYESFKLDLASMRQKPKALNTLKTLTSVSCHRELSSFKRQNNKEILKEKLRKLLVESQNGQIELKRVKTICTLPSSKNSQKELGGLRIQDHRLDYRQKDFLPGLDSHSIFQNSSENKSRRILTSIGTSRGNCISQLVKENEKIRRLIKRKLEEKARLKQMKNNINSNMLNKNCERTKTGLNQKTNNIINTQKKIKLKVKIAKYQHSIKPDEQRVHLYEKKENKQNSQKNLAVSIPLIKLNKIHLPEERRLKNILF